MIWPHPWMVMNTLQVPVQEETWRMSWNLPTRTMKNGMSLEWTKASPEQTQQIGRGMLSMITVCGTISTYRVATYNWLRRLTVQEIAA